MNALKLKLDAKQVEQTLAMLPAKLNERVRKRAIKTAFNPARNSLRALWRAAPYKGKDPHRRAIASATRLDVRRNGSGPQAPTQFALGVQYGRKGGSRAKGRQRIWHLLEHGFRHYNGGRIPGAKRSTNWVAKNHDRLMKALQDAILVEAAELMGGNGAK